VTKVRAKEPRYRS